MSADGKGTFLRYRVVPDAGEEHLDEAALKDQDHHFLYEELPKRVAEGPVTFKVLAQVAEEGDKVDDATVHWPDSRQVVELGVLKLEGTMGNSGNEQKHIIQSHASKGLRRLGILYWKFVLVCILSVVGSAGLLVEILSRGYDVATSSATSLGRGLLFLRVIYTMAAPLIACSIDGAMLQDCN